MELVFRTLKANEIDVRIGTQKLLDPKDKYSAVIEASYLLYKDARVDMTLLDEVVGAMNWQRTHEFKDGKLYCTVAIWDDEKKQWVAKEDVGVESNTEAEKGQASDSFKRACVNIGIGRELYTAPFIYIKANPGEDLRKIKMRVKHIAYDENRKITELIIEDNKGNVRYEKYDREKITKEPVKEKATKEKITKEPVKKEEVVNLDETAHLDSNLVMQLVKLGGSLEIVRKYYKHNSISEITNEEIQALVNRKLGK